VSESIGALPVQSGAGSPEFAKTQEAPPSIVLKTPPQVKA
jgi:hypothetical protein